jgi:hypothetical protein
VLERLQEAMVKQWIKQFMNSNRYGKVSKKCLNSVSTVIVTGMEKCRRNFCVLWDLIIWWWDVVAELRVNLYGP